MSIKFENKMMKIYSLYPHINKDILLLFFKTYKLTPTQFKTFEQSINRYMNINDYSPKKVVEIYKLRKEQIQRNKDNGLHQSIINEEYYIILLGKELGSKIWNNNKKSKSKKCKAWQDANPESSKNSYQVRINNGTIGKAYSIRCKEYWMRLGYSEIEAKSLVADKQKRDLNHYKKHYENYEEKWLERQIKWQNTLNSKSEEEKQLINSKKGTFSYKQCIRRGMNNLEAIEYIHKYTGINKIYFTEDELINAISEWINEKEYRKYLKPNSIIKHFSGINCFAGDFDKPNNYEEWILNNFNLTSKDFKIWQQTESSYKCYNAYTQNNKFLRSSNEISFYLLLLKMNLIEGIDFDSDVKYPNSNKRCDFYLIKHNIYIELTGLNTDIYNKNIEYKKTNYNSIILSSQSEYENYLKSIFL